MKRLTASGYRVAPQWRVGAFRIDLVVEGESRRLAIECDGDRYQPLEKLPEDLDRQGVLERMGWSFARIRGSEFFRNPERALKPVIEKLQLLEIFPVKSKANAGGKLLTSALPIDSVIRRAEELRNDWNSREATSSKRQGSPKSMKKTAISRGTGPAAPSGGKARGFLRRFHPHRDGFTSRRVTGSTGFGIKPSGIGRRFRRAYKLPGFWLADRRIRSLAFLFIHRLVRLRHEFSKRNRFLGIES